MSRRCEVRFRTTAVLIRLRFLDFEKACPFSDASCVKPNLSALRPVLDGNKVRLLLFPILKPATRLCRCISFTSRTTTP